MCTTNSTNSNADSVECMATTDDRRCPKRSNIKEENKKKNEYKKKKFDGICYHCGQKGHMSKDCRAQRNGSNKKFEKAEKAVEEDELVLCLLTRDNEEKNTQKKKVRFAENEKQP